MGWVDKVTLCGRHSACWTLPLNIDISASKNYTVLITVAAVIGHRNMTIHYLFSSIADVDNGHSDWTAIIIALPRSCWGTAFNTLTFFWFSVVDVYQKHRFPVRIKVPCTGLTYPKINKQIKMCYIGVCFFHHPELTNSGKLNNLWLDLYLSLCGLAWRRTVVGDSHWHHTHVRHQALKHSLMNPCQPLSSTSTLLA